MPGTPDLIEGMKALDAALPDYERRWQFFAGDLPEQFTSQRIKNLIEGTATDYRFRLARIPVESLANRLRIASVTASNERANRAIEEIRTGNDMELWEPHLTERTLVLADSYMMVWPILDEDEERPADAETIATGVELAYQSPFSCRAMYDAEDGRHVRYVIRRWKVSTALGDCWRAEVWYLDRLEAFISNPGSKGLDINEWNPYAEDEFSDPVPAIPGQNWPEPHDFGMIPIIHARTDLPYGRSELDDFSGAQNAVTKATATQATSIESHGWRERYRIADDKSILEQARDSVPWGDDADATSADLTPPVSGRRQGPGTEQLYHGTKAVGEFAAPDIGAMIDPIDAWIRWGAAASSTPLGEFDPRFGAQMSGVAWDRAERPMRAKEADRKRFLVRFWREVYGLALDIIGVHDYGEIEVQWSPPEVTHDPEWWAVAQIRRTFGVPERVILAEANYTAEQLAEWDANQDEGLLLDSRIARIAALGEAMQTLGAGASLLGIPPERTAKLIEDLLGDAGSPGRLILEEKEEPKEIEGDDGDNDESQARGAAG